jgi:macrolide-specific efflux system membrane fusion protein
MVRIRPTNEAEVGPLSAGRPSRKESTVRRRTTVISAVGAALLVGALATTGIVMAGASAPTDIALAEATAEVQSVKSTVTGKGALSAAATANASFQSVGTITSITVAVGQHVTAGQVLATIDSAAADREVERAGITASAADRAVAVARGNADHARQTLTAAQQALVRAQNEPPPATAPSGEPDPTATPAPTIPTTDDRPEKIAAAEQAVREAEAGVAAADAAVADAIGSQSAAASEVSAASAVKTATTLTAPIGGVVTAINGTIGSITSGGGSSQETSAANSGTSGFIQISDTSSWQITVAVSEADIAAVKVDQPASVALAGTGGSTATGRVVSTAPTPTTSTDGVVSYAVAVALDAVPKDVRIGRTGFVSIVVAEAKDAVVVPTEAVSITEPGHGTVQVRNDDGELATIDVTTGLIGDGKTQVTTGLKSGTVVVIPIPTAVPGDLPSDGDAQLGGGPW